MGVQRAFLPRAAKAKVLVTPPVPKVIKKITSWDGFARAEKSFTYSETTLAWEEEKRICNSKYKARFLKAIKRIRRAIKTYNLPPLSSVRFDYCGEMANIEYIARTIGTIIPKGKHITIVAHDHYEEDQADIDETINNEMQLEVNLGNLREFPWELTVENSYGTTVDYEAEDIENFVGSDGAYF